MKMKRSFIKVPTGKKIFETTEVVAINKIMQNDSIDFVHIPLIAAANNPIKTTTETITSGFAQFMIGM